MQTFMRLLGVLAMCGVFVVLAISAGVPSAVAGIVIAASIAGIFDALRRARRERCGNQP
jgi:hypothetical protein